MATEVFSVKMDGEYKERIKGLITESGLEGKDFMEQLIKIYELNTARDLMPQVAGDVEELQAITKRICDIFSGLIERSNTLLQDRENSLKEEIEKKHRSMSLVQEKLDSKNVELEELKREKEELVLNSEEFIKKLQESERKVYELEKNHRDIVSSKDELIKEYKDKNDNLSGMLLEYQQYKDKNKELSSSIDSLKFEIENLKRSLAEKETTEEKIKNEIQMLKSQNEMNLQKAGMEKEKAILELREKYQSKFEELNNEYNSKVKNLLHEIERAKLEKVENGEG